MKSKPSKLGDFTLEIWGPVVATARVAGNDVVLAPIHVLYRGKILFEGETVTNLTTLIVIVPPREGREGEVIQPFVCPIDVCSLRDVDDRGADEGGRGKWSSIIGSGAAIIGGRPIGPIDGDTHQRRVQAVYFEWQ